MKNGIVSFYSFYINILGLKEQKLLVQNLPLKRWIKQEQARRDGEFRDQIVQAPPIAHEFDNANTNEKEVFDGKIPEGNFYHQYTERDLEKILSEQKKIIDALKKHKQPKYLADRILFIFDDLVGSSLFSMAQDNLFKGITKLLQITQYHHNFNLLFLSYSVIKFKCKCFPFFQQVLILGIDISVLLLLWFLKDIKKYLKL